MAQALGSHTDRLLSGLAGNPSAPDDVLVRLARHRAAAKVMSWRRDTLADPVVDAIVAHRDPGSLVHLHAGRVSAPKLRELAAHPDPVVRRARADLGRDRVARGVDTPIDVLEALFDTDRATLAGSADPALRAAVAGGWSDPPPDVRRALLTDSDPLVRAAASRPSNPPVPADLQQAYLADPATRLHVADRAHLSPETAAALAGDPDFEVRAALARNPALPARVLRLLADDPSAFVRAALIPRADVSDELRAALHRDIATAAQAGDVEAEVALVLSDAVLPTWLGDVPVTDRLTHLDSPIVAFRCALAATRDLPAWAWERLDQDPDPLVRRHAAGRPTAPAAVLERLLRGHGEGAKFPPLTDHPNFPRPLARLATDAAPGIRRLALRDPDLPAPVLAALAADTDPRVRRAAAGDPRLGPDELERLLGDADPGVAAEAAAHPALPVARMRQILDLAGRSAR